MDRRMSAMEAKVGAWMGNGGAEASAASPPPAKRMWGQDRFASQTASSMSAASTTADEGVIADVCKIWISGFPRKMLRTVLEDHARQTLQIGAPALIQSMVKIKAYNNENTYGMRFPSPAD